MAYHALLDQVTPKLQTDEALAVRARLNAIQQEWEELLDEVYDEAIAELLATGEFSEDDLDEARHQLREGGW